MNYFTSAASLNSDRCLVASLRPMQTHLQSLRSRSCSIRTQQLHRSAYIAFLKYGNYLDKIDYSAEEVR